MKTAPLPHQVGVQLYPMPRRPARVDQTTLQEAALTLMAEHCCMYVKDFALSLEEFMAFTEELGLNFMDYRGGASHRLPVGERPTLLTVTGHERGFPIPLHGELYYQKWQPDYLLFYCEKQALLGGSTLLANAARVYQSLAPEVRDYLEETPVKYVRQFGADDWPAIYQTHDRQLVGELCQAAGLMHQFLPNGGLRTEFLDHAFRGEPRRYLNNILPNYYLQKAGRSEAGVLTAADLALPGRIIQGIEQACRACTYKIAMKPGDAVIVNNRRALHGRSAFLGKRNVFLRMGNLQ